MRLTELVIKNLKAPDEGQVTYTDDLLPGFGVRVSCGGAKAFVLVYGHARKRVTLERDSSDLNRVWDSHRVASLIQDAGW